MARQDKLVVILPKEPTTREAGRYFKATNNSVRWRTIEDPLGNIRRIHGKICSSPDLAYTTSEYLYMEVTQMCNLSCSGCGSAQADRRISEPKEKHARYISIAFLDTLVRDIAEFPHYLHDRGRLLFYGGGEPLLDMVRFGEINQALQAAKNTDFWLITNALNLPLSEREFVAAVRDMGEPGIMFSYSLSHATQYLLKARNPAYADLIPQDVKPEAALAEKLMRLAAYCRKNDLECAINIVTSDDSNGRRSQIEHDLRQSLIDSAVKYFETSRDGYMEPCSKQRELAIRHNGDLYPHCQHIFNGQNMIGTLGILRD